MAHSALQTNELRSTATRRGVNGNPPSPTGAPWLFGVCKREDQRVFARETDGRDPFGISRLEVVVLRCGIEASWV